jgi:hypothetical protein
VDNLVNNIWKTAPNAHAARLPDRSDVFCSTKKVFINHTLKFLARGCERGLDRIGRGL